MTIKVIGAGLPRTGTFSLKAALEKLLDAPCYHMSEVYAHPEHVKFWHNAGLGEAVDWKAFFSPYGATVDAPSAYFWKELMQVYPDAIVVLTIRDAESWWKSASKTVLKVGNSSQISEEQRAMSRVIPSPFQSKFPKNKESMIEAFERHNAAVRTGVPAQRLLVWNAKEGWEPICKALNLPIPDEPFPHTNTTKEFQREWFARRILGERLSRILGL